MRHVGLIVLLGGCRSLLGIDEAVPLGDAGDAAVDDPGDASAGCIEHADCESEACLPGGACAAESSVAYVAPAAMSSSSCTRASPCLSVASALATGREYMKLAGTIIESVVIDGRDVTFLAAPGATVQPPPSMHAFEIRGASQVTINDLIIASASGGGRGIAVTNTSRVALHRVTVVNNEGGGIVVATNASLTVSRSTISHNGGGGIEVLGMAFDITNSFIYRNGTSTTGVGGVRLGAAAATSRFEFNTVVDNVANSSSVGGVACTAGSFQAPNNIVARNQPIQVTGEGCNFSTSTIQPEVDELAFASPDVAPLSYRLLAGSSAIDQPTTPSTIAIDFDGDPRPARRDLGADEYVP